MKYIIIASCFLAVVSAEYFGIYPARVPVLDHQGFQEDTLEVARAKAAHFAAHAEVISSSGFGHVAPAYYAGHHQTGYTPSYDQNGFQLDTPEVAHAKAAHLAELAKANANEHQTLPYVPRSYSHPYTYSAPFSHGDTAYGYPAVSHNGAPVDTPEVTQAKAAHAAAHAEAYIRYHNH